MGSAALAAPNRASATAASQTDRNITGGCRVTVSKRWYPRFVWQGRSASPETHRSTTDVAEEPARPPGPPGCPMDLLPGSAPQA